MAYIVVCYCSNDRCHSERNELLALSEQKLALSVAEWVEGEESLWFSPDASP